MYCWGFGLLMGVLKVPKDGMMYLKDVIIIITIIIIIITIEFSITSTFPSFLPPMGCSGRKRSIPATRQALRSGVENILWWMLMSPAASVVEVTAMKQRVYKGTRRTCVNLGYGPEYHLALYFFAIVK